MLNYQTVSVCSIPARSKSCQPLALAWCYSLSLAGHDARFVMTCSAGSHAVTVVPVLVRKVEESSADPLGVVYLHGKMGEIRSPPWKDVWFLLRQFFAAHDKKQNRQSLKPTHTIKPRWGMVYHSESHIIPIIHRIG